ncbi:patatin-like phospholipase family protein [Frondihabitans cladoniiphilus]|uniref:Patatin-like phospholipase family protein n=1 Tax=Frondihabitans cladoniiphilus TaxID=715785 RepID=A0ABP8WCJ9_9MICO
MTKDALVLAGGGVAGIAWETGVLRGLEDEHPRLVSSLRSESTLLVGTSAGSTVAAQLALGRGLRDLFDAQTAEESAEVFADIDLQEFAAGMAGLLQGGGSREDQLRRIGEMALAADTPSTAVRHAVIEARIPSETWPEHPLLIPAVDARTGALRVFDRASGVSLVSAVEASCAVPGIWPTVPIQGHDYMDGGARSIANADLAAGSDRVLILVPSPEVGPYGPSLAPDQLEGLAPGRVHVVYADEASVAAMGANPLDPAARRPTAIAGRELGRRIAADIAAFWG